MIARKIRELIVIQNEPVQQPIRKEPNLLKNILLVGLMAFAVTLTELTLIVVGWIKKIES